MKKISLLKKSRIMIVEDNRIIAMDIMNTVRQLGYQAIEPVFSGEIALERVKKTKPDLILMDIKLNDKIDGIEAGTKIRKQHDIPIVFLTAYGDKKTLRRSKKACPFGYLIKPFSQRSLAAAIETALFRYEAEQKIKHINSILDSIHHISQLISSENNREKLLKGCCQYLVDIRGYKYASILIFDNKNVAPLFFSSGMEKKKVKMQELIKQKRYPLCYKKALDCKDLVLTTIPAENCGSCPLKIKYKGYFSMSVRLQYKNNIFGVLKITTKKNFNLEAKEETLIKQVARDIASALYNIHIEKKRHASEKKYQQLVETLTEGIWVVDKDLVTTFVNPRMAQILGYSANEMIGQKLFYFVDKEFISSYRHFLETMAEDTTNQHIFQLQSKDGKNIYTRITGSACTDEKGNFMGIIASVSDITKQKLLENRIMEISSLEQQRIGKNLHDSLGQLLTGIAFKSKLLEEKFKTNNSAEYKATSEITSLISQAIEQTQLIAKGLLDFNLHSNGLIFSLKELIRNIESLFGICICFEYDDIEIIDPQVSIQFYKIIQESVNNAIRHGKAENIYISLKKHLKRIMLEIRDDGKGIVEKINKNTGLGINIMNYRAESIRASIEIAQNKPSGVIVRCILFEK